MTRTYPNFLSLLIAKKAFQDTSAPLKKWEMCCNANHVECTVYAYELLTSVTRQVSVLHSCSDKNRSRWKQERRAWGVFFPLFLGGWGDIRMQWCVHMEALFNTLWLGPYSPDRIGALCYSACFKMDVHWSVKPPHRDLSVAWLLVTVHCWIPLDHTAF